MAMNDSGKILDADICNELVSLGYSLRHIQRELCLETPATWLDIEAFKRRHLVPSKW